MSPTPPGATPSTAGDDAVPRENPYLSHRAPAERLTGGAGGAQDPLGGGLDGVLVAASPAGDVGE